MGRGKVAMEFITREKTRMLTFKNRKTSLFKKAHELSVLCDVDVCVIIDGFLTANQRNNQSEIWPENSEEVRRIIAKYKAAIPNARRKTTSSLSSFFPERQEDSNKKMPFPVWDSRLDSFSAEQCFKLLEDLDQKLKTVDKRMDELQTHVDDQLPIIDSSSGEEQIKNDGCFVFASPPDEFIDDCAMTWVNQNFQTDFPLNNVKLLDFPIESMTENYINLPDPYIVMPPLDDYSALSTILPDPYVDMPPLGDYSAAATLPSESCGLQPLPSSSTPSALFLGRPEMTWSGFFDGNGDGDYQMNDKEEERLCTFDDIANFLFS